MYANALDYITEYGIGAAGNVKVVEWALRDHLVSGKERQAAKISKELGYKQVVHLDSPLENKLKW